MKRIMVGCVALVASVSGMVQADGYCAQDSSDGIILEEARSRVVSVYRQPVKFLDRSGVRKATVIAQERAKGNIVRFFSQEQSTSREIEEVDQGGEEATRIVDSNGDLVARKITRNQSEILRQLDASFAVSNLKGILQIEESYDKELSEVCVAMGYSAKSTSMVEKSKGWMEGKGSTTTSSGGVSLEPSNQTVDSYSRVRKGDW
jgi:hypothetical protein